MKITQSFTKGTRYVLIIDNYILIMFKSSKKSKHTKYSDVS